MTVLIPSFEPTDKLTILISDIRKLCGFPILIVDDGSGETFAPIFKKAEEAGCTVLRHAKNTGKGEALKTGFRYLLSLPINEGVVCADSDGQHRPAIS
jgi:glycosyltransferase involved in cell wall biosynthesis